MNEWATFVTAELDKRNWGVSILSRRSGLSRTMIYNILGDKREQLRDMPHRETMQALAQALEITYEEIMIAAARAYGIPVGEPLVIATATGLSDAELVAELGRRLAAKGDRTEP